ncbi:MAG: tetratricopeptide repeat protein [Saprospiraceae bacterium]
MIAHIEAYLDDQITKTDLEKLANEAGVPNIDEEIEWFRQSQLAIETAGLRDQLTQAFAAPAPKQGIVRGLGSMRTILAVAASILLLILVYWGVEGRKAPGLYAQFEYTDPGLPVLMSQSKDHQLYDALTYYSEANYEVAATKLEQLKAAGIGSDTTTYYWGASLLYQGKGDAASPALQEIARNPASPFQARAEWLLVLAALQQDRLTEARQLLPAILTNQAHPFYESATRLQQVLIE